MLPQKPAQKSLKLPLDRLPDESASKHRLRQYVMDVGHLPREKGPHAMALFLKRQARQIMADVTVCPPETLPAHLARLDSLRELIELATRFEFVPGNETILSGKQLIFPATVADFLACLIVTRNSHRAPSFINADDDRLARIEKGLHTLAGLISRSPALNAMLEQEAE